MVRGGRLIRKNLAETYRPNSKTYKSLANILMQTRYSDKNYVRPSVCQTREYCDKTEEKSVQIFIPYLRSFTLVFREEECLVGATPST